MPSPPSTRPLAAGLLIAAALASHAASPPDLQAPALNDALEAHVGQLQNAYEQARAQPGNAEANAEYCMVLHAYDALALAEACYRRLQQIAPTDFRWFYLAGIVQEALIRPDDAIASYERAMGINREFVHAPLRRARLLMEFRDADKAGTAYRDLLEAHSDSALVQGAAGRWYASRRDNERAIEILTRALEADPSQSEAQYALAMAYREEGDLENAKRRIAMHRQYRKIPPRADPVMAEVMERDQSLRSRIDLATELLSGGRLQEAADEFAAVLAIDPNNALAHLNLITSRTGLGNLEQAEAHHRRALDARPGWARAHYRWGRAQFEAGLTQGAIESLKLAIASDPHHADAHTYLGLALEQVARTDEAILRYRDAIEAAPGHRAAHLYLGTLLWEPDRPQKSAEHFERALQIEDERTALFHERIGNFYLQVGETPLAIDHFRRGRDSAMASGMPEVAKRLVRQWDRAMGVR
jgi:tetratricopeptide (TPR) repeat protein